MTTDIRWKQRFNNYLHAFRQLEEAVTLSNERELSKLEQQGLIQGFEYTHELAWNLLKDYLADQGFGGLVGSKDSTREAFKNGLVSNGEVLDELDESYLPYKFDISAFEMIENDKLKEHIERVGKVFYSKEGDSGAGMRKGWEEKKLGEVCEIKPQKFEARKKLKPNEMVSFVPMEDMGIGQKIFIPKQERLLSEVEGSYTYLANNDVLLAKITPCFENGKLGIAKNLRNEIGFGSSEYIVFRTNETLYNEFLYYFLSQEDFRINGAKNMSGAVGHKRVSKEFVENTQIPIPPLPEQKRIVAILNEAFSGITRAKEIAEKNLANAKEIFESYLQGVFANPKDRWEEMTLGEIYDVRDGTHDSPKYHKEGYALVTSKNLKNDKLNFDEISYISKDDFDQINTRSKVDKGYVLFAMIGTIGNPVVVDIVPNFAIKKCCTF